MNQKDLIKYGLIGLAVYFLFLKKEDAKTDDDSNTGGGDGPEVATGGNNNTGGPSSNASGGTLNDGSQNQGDPSDDENFTPYSS